MKYSEEIFNKLLFYKNKIVEPCTLCSGKGYYLDESICQCMQVYVYISRLFLSSIPSEYWQLDINELEIPKDVYSIVLKYCELIGNAVDKHKCIMFTGNNGVGKTAVMCEIGKACIVNNYSVFYFTFENLVDSFYPKKTEQEYSENEAFLNRLKNADVHLLDEFGKSPLKENSLFVPQKVEDYVKKTISNKVIITTTNYNLETLRKLFGDSSVDSLERQTAFLNIDGKDYTKKRNSQWVEDLKTPYDYFHKNILKYARRM